MFKQILKCLIFSGLFIFTNAIAENTVDYDDIKITSDVLIVDKHRNTSDFRNNVIVWCGDMILKTNELVIEVYEDHGKKRINRLIAPGKLSAIKQDMTEIVVADTAEYSGKTHTLTLKGDIYLQKEERVVKCNELVYIMPERYVR